MPSKCDHPVGAARAGRWIGRDAAGDFDAGADNGIDLTVAILRRIATVHTRTDAAVQATRQAGHRGEPGDRGSRERPRDVGRANLADVLAQERDVVFAALVGGLADDRRVGRFDHRHQQLRVDLAGAEVGVPVGARARGVA